MNGEIQLKSFRVSELNARLKVAFEKLGFDVTAVGNGRIILIFTPQYEYGPEQAQLLNRRLAWERKQTNKPEREDSDVER